METRSKNNERNDNTELNIVYTLFRSAMRKDVEGCMVPSLVAFLLDISTP